MKRKLLIGGLVLVLLLAFISGIQYAAKGAKTSNARKVADTFVGDVLANKAAQTYPRLTEATREIETQSTWAAKVSTVSSFFRNQTATFKSQSSDGKVVAIKYSIKGSDGNYVFALALVQEEKGWFVQVFNSELAP